MPIDDATWAQVRAAYIANEMSITALCEKFQLASPTLYRRRIQEGWPLRGTQPAAFSSKAKRQPPPVAAAASPEPSPAPPPAKPHAATSRAARAALILRLYNAIDLKLTQMEKLMSGPDATKETSSADHEREARTLTGLVRNFERVTEMDSDLTKPAGKSAAAKSARAGNTANAAPADAAAATGPAALANAAALTADPARAMLLRRDIAQRLERIMAKGNPPGDAG